MTKVSMMHTPSLPMTIKIKKMTEPLMILKIETRKSKQNSNNKLTH